MRANSDAHGKMRLLFVIACTIAFVAAGYYFVSMLGWLEGLMVLAAASTLVYILWLVGLNLYFAWLLRRKRTPDGEEPPHS